MVGLLHAMAFMVLLLIGWVIWNNKPLPFNLSKKLQVIHCWIEQLDSVHNASDCCCCPSLATPLPKKFVFKNLICRTQWLFSCFFFFHNILHEGSFCKNASYLKILGKSSMYVRTFLSTQLKCTGCTTLVNIWYCWVVVVKAPLNFLTLVCLQRKFASVFSFMIFMHLPRKLQVNHWRTCRVINVFNWSISLLFTMLLLCKAHKGLIYVQLLCLWVLLVFDFSKVMHRMQQHFCAWSFAVKLYTDVRVV